MGIYLYEHIRVVALMRWEKLGTVWKSGASWDTSSMCIYRVRLGVLLLRSRPKYSLPYGWDFASRATSHVGPHRVLREAEDLLLSYVLSCGIDTLGHLLILHRYRADATIASQATGAMSWAFITALKKNPQQSYVQLLNSIRDELATRYTQKPQLSCSHPLGQFHHTYPAFGPLVNSRV